MGNYGQVEAGLTI